MADMTGRRDRPNVGPLNSAQLAFDGVLTNYYWYHNESTGMFELVSPMAAGTPDRVEKEFRSMPELLDYARSLVRR